MGERFFKTGTTMGLGIMLQRTADWEGVLGRITACLPCLYAVHSICCRPEIDYWSKMKYFPDLMAYYFLQ